jgi:membrane associated rhomboid family serine protease
LRLEVEGWTKGGLKFWLIENATGARRFLIFYYLLGLTNGLIQLLKYESKR